MIDLFFLVIKHGDFGENSSRNVRSILQSLPIIQSRWPEETKAVAGPKSLGWSPQNVGIVTIDWGVIG